MISVTILTYNAEQHLKRVLEALSSFEEIIVLDSGSTDATEAIAKQYPQVRFLVRDFHGFGEAHEFASAQAKYDWILSIDSDEVVSPALVQEIHHLHLDPKCVYAIPSHNMFRGKWIKGCGWHPRTPVRFYNRKTARFSLDKVHEKVLYEGLKKHNLSAPLWHYTYMTFSDFLIKMERYTTLFAQQNQGKRDATIWTALAHCVGTFLKSYVLQRGCLVGMEGFVISCYQAQTAFYKYLKLYEINRPLTQKTLEASQVPSLTLPAQDTPCCLP